MNKSHSRAAVFAMRSNGARREALKCSYSVALVTSVRPVAVAGHLATEWAEWLFYFPSLAAKNPIVEAYTRGRTGFWSRRYLAPGVSPRSFTTVQVGCSPTELCNILGQGGLPSGADKGRPRSFAKNKLGVAPRSFARFRGVALRRFASIWARGRPSELAKF